jgi:hypothetical protein
MKKYRASLDRTAMFLTTLVISLLSLVSAATLYKAFAEETQAVPAVLFSVFSITAIFLCYLYRPAGYCLTPTELIILRPAKNIVIPYSDIRNISSPASEELKWSIRTFGVGGVFGYWGYFRNGRFGNMLWYATHHNNYLLVETQDKKILLTPDDSSMTDDLMLRIKQLHRT